MVTFADFNLAQDRATTVQPPNAYNGNLGAVATATSATFIESSNYFVLNAEGTSINLTATLAYRINCSMSNPDNAVAITAAHLETARTVINRTFEWYTVIRTLKAADNTLVIAFSRTDVITRASAEAAGNWANCHTVAVLLYEDFVGDTIKAAYLCPDPHMASILVVINAIHRKTCSMHNWITRAITQSGTASNRAVHAAGEYEADLLIYANEANTGHDMFHVLDNPTIFAAATMLTGAAALAGGTDLGGITIGADPVSLSDHFGIPESCIDRWPVGKLGVSAIHLAVYEINATCSAISIATKSFPTARIKAVLTEIKAFASDRAVDRTLMLAIKEAVGSIAGFACGFNSNTREGKERIESGVSLTRLVERHSDLMPAGIKLGQYFANYELNKDTALAIAKQFSVGISEFAAAVAVMAHTANVANHAAITAANTALAAVDINTYDVDRLAAVKS